MPLVVCVYPIDMEGYALVTELKNATEDVLATGETFILDDTSGVFQLCFVLEKILNNGLKDLALFGKTSFWEFLEHLDQCLPGTTNILNDVRECSKTPLGRGRVFIRVAFNEGAVVDYLKALVWNRELAKKYYKDSALMRNDQYFASILSYLEKLADAKFSLVVKDSGFDDPAYYDKMALELVMSGQRASSSSLLSSSSLSSSSLSSSSLGPSAPATSQPAPTAYVSAVTTPVVQKSQAQATPPPTQKKVEEAQASPQTPSQSAPVQAPPKEATTPEKKRSPTTKRKTTARSRTIIMDNDGGTTPPTTESPELRSTPSAPGEKPRRKAKPLRIDEPPTAHTETTPPEPMPTKPTSPVVHAEPTPQAVSVEPIPTITLDTTLQPDDTQPTSTPTTPAITAIPDTPTTPITPASPDSAHSISESELVPVKMHNLRSPHSTTDTESIFSSAEMLSSQTSTPSFTVVTDDTDLSPQTTPNLRNSTNTTSPSLTLNSEHSSLDANLSAINTSGEVSTSSLTPLEPNLSAENTTSEPTSLRTESQEQSESTPELTQAPEPSHEPTELAFAQVSPHVEHKDLQEPEPTEPEHVAEPSEEPVGQQEPVEPTQESVSVATEEPTREPEQHSYRPPTPTLGDFNNMELPIDTPILSKPPTLEPPPPAAPNGTPAPKPALPPLIEALKRDVYALLGNDNALIREADSLLETIENILSHGIRSGPVFLHSPLPMDQVWSFVRFLPSYLPGTESLLDEIRANREIESDMGRARSWMRAALNHMSLGKHLKVLLADRTRTTEYYEDFALLRSYEHQAMVLVLIESLNSARFCLQTHDAYIDIKDKKYMEKRPLATSQQGDKSKKRIVSLRRKKASIENSEHSEQAEPAEEEVVVTRRRGSSASRTKKPNFLTSSGESSAPSNTPPSDRSSPSPPSSVTNEVENPASPTKNGKTQSELPPMPQIPTSEFVPIGADLFQQLQQFPPEASLSSTPPQATPPIDTPSTPHSSTSSTPASDSPPIYTSLDDLPRTIPFGVPEYEPDFGPSEPSYSFGHSESYTYGIDIPKRETSPLSFFKTPMSASFAPTSSLSLGSDLSGSVPLSFSYSASSDDDSRVTVTDDFLRARLSEDYEPRAMSKALDVVRTNRKDKERRASLSDIDSDEGSNHGSLRFGSLDSESLPALPTHYILDATRKVQRNTKCPGCSAAISHGLFSTAKLCSYYCAYYCGKCHVGDEAVIPAKLVHQLDVKPYPVCSEARGHIHQYYRSPQLNMRLLNPAAYRYSSTLEKAGKLRRQLKYLGDYVKTCRNKETLLNLMDGRQYMLDSLDVYSLRDLIDAISGSLLPFMYNIMEKFISHVTKTCMTCKGKGFYCEFCNSGDLLFSWMVLRSSDCKVCPQCKSLSHTKCYKKGNGDCPKCKRIASLKTKPSTTPAPHSYLT